MADVDIEGLETLIYNMDNVTEEIRKKIWDHIKTSAKELRDEARELAPEETGKLKRSIKIEYDEDNLEAIVRAKTFYAHIDEFGAVNHPAKPFMTPAMEKERNPFLKGLSDIVK